MNKTVKTIGIGLTTLGILAMAAIAAFAASGGFRSQQSGAGNMAGGAPISGPGSGAAIMEPGSFVGEVTAVDADHITLLTLNNRTLKVNINPQTIIRLAERQRAGNLSDVKVSDKVRVNGRPNGGGTIEAQIILILPDDTDLRTFLPPPQGNPGLPGDQIRPSPTLAAGEPIDLVGETVAPDRDSFRLQAGNGQEWEVRILKQTVVRLVEGDQLGEANDLQAGDQVRVRGLPKGPEVIEAQLIAILPHGYHIAGMVKNVKDETITLATPQGELVVVVNDTTQFQSVPGYSGTPNFQNIREGNHVIAYGELQTNGRLIARLVILQREKDPAGMVPGPQPPGVYPGPTP